MSCGHGGGLSMASAAHPTPPGIVKHELEKAWHDDAGKPQFELIPQWGLLELAKVAEFGKQKYGKHNYAEYADNWDWLEPTGSILRHTFAFLRGEWYDDESGLAHLAHAAFNALMLVDLWTKEKGTDDRSPFAIGYSPSEPSQHDPEEWKRRVDDLNREAVMSVPIEMNAIGPETPKKWRRKMIAEIPEEELHDDLTFPPFAPAVSAYWRARMEDAVEEIMSVKAKEGVVTCGS